MTDKSTQTYVVNLDFDGGDLGEIIVASPKLVADWEDAGFISPVDENGNRLIKVGRRAAVDEGAVPVELPAGGPREVTKDDLVPPE